MKRENIFYILKTSLVLIMAFNTTIVKAQWSYNGSTIYRYSKVGINLSNPTRTFQVGGEFGLRAGANEIGYFTGFSNSSSKNFWVCSSLQHDLILMSGRYTDFGINGSGGHMYLSNTGLTIKNKLVVGAGVQIKSNLLVGDGGNAVITTRHINGKSHTSNADDHLFLNYSNSKMVYLGNPSNYSGLNVYGKIWNMVNTGADVAYMEHNNGDAYLRINASKAGTNSGIEFKANGRKSWLISNDKSTDKKLSFQYYDGSFKTAMEIRETNGKMFVWAPMFCVASSSNSCPDYVFAEDYKLPTIDELEHFIKNEKHLPNVPSAKEIGADGYMNMEKMIYSTLEKVEESSLYIIQLNKELREKNEEIKQLQDRLISIEKSLIKLNSKQF